MYGEHGEYSTLGTDVFWWLIILYGVSYLVCSFLLTMKAKNEVDGNKYGIGSDGKDTKYIKISVAMFVLGGFIALMVRLKESDIYFRDGQDAWVYIFCGAIAVFGLYMLPSMIARKNGHESTTAIVWLNYFFGATIIVYIILIIWASKKPTNPVVVMQQTTSDADDLKKYKELLDSGAITQEEYDAKKKQILNI